MSRVRIERVVAPAQFTQAALVLGEYRAWLEITLDIIVDDVQASARGEYRSLEAYYSARRGGLLLATVDGEPAGIVGLRRIDRERAELRRLYVRHLGRGLGLGRGLVQAHLELAREHGYETVFLDTRPQRMPHAQAIYQALGFRHAAPAAVRGPEALMRMEIDLTDEAAAARLAA